MAEQVGLKSDFVSAEAVKVAQREKAIHGKMVRITSVVILLIIS